MASSSLDDPTSSRSTLRMRHPPSSYPQGGAHHTRASRSLEIQPRQTETSPHSSRTSRIMTSVRRSISVSHRSQSQVGIDRTGMYSTPAERDSFTRFRRNDPAIPPPTVEQIAMGLHISRTPHLRSSSHSYPPRTAHGSQHHLPITLPPAPSRSSLKQKKPSTVSSATPGAGVTPSASSTAVNSNSNLPSTSATIGISLKARVTRLISHTTTPLPSSKSDSTLKERTSLPPKKAVRFSTPVKGE